MVPPAPHARPSISIVHAFEPCLFEPKSRLRGNGIFREPKSRLPGKRNFQGRDKEAETAWKVQGPRCRDKASLNNPANSGLVSENQEISVSGRMRGGPGRTRTSNQAVMSAVTAPKRSAIIGIFARVRRRLFLFGYGVSLVIRWLSIVKKHQRFV